MDQVDTFTILDGGAVRFQYPVFNGTEDTILTRDGIEAVRRFLNKVPPSGRVTVKDRSRIMRRQALLLKADRQRPDTLSSDERTFLEACRLIRELDDVIYDLNRELQEEYGCEPTPRIN